MKSWKRIEPTVTSKIGYRVIITKTFVMPDGAVHHFQTIGSENSHCIATIALTKDNQVIVARQFRLAQEAVLDELPGGGAEHDEDFEQAARRELLEETGYEAGKVEFLGDVVKDAYNNAVWHYFLATDCVPRKGGQKLDPTEHIDVVLLSIDQVLENGRQARMTDTEALFLAYEELQMRRKQQ